MAQRTWFITGVSGGFGRQLTEQLLERGDHVIGTVRDTRILPELTALFALPSIFAHLVSSLT